MGTPIHIRRALFVSVVSAVFLALPTALHGQTQTVADTTNWSQSQQDIWEQERTYWQFRAAGDLEGFMSLWAEDFVGWSGPGIIDRSDVRRLIKREFEERSGKPVVYKLIPRAVRVHGKMGITFYSVAFGDTAGAVAGDARFHHLWRREDGVWKIVAGMSAPPLEREER